MDTEKGHLIIRYFRKPNRNTLMARIKLDGNHLTDMSTKIKFGSARFESNKFNDYRKNKELTDFEIGVYERYENAVKAGLSGNALIEVIKGESGIAQSSDDTLLFSYMIKDYRAKAERGELFNNKTGKKLSKESCQSGVTVCNVIMNDFVMKGNDFDFRKYNIVTSKALGEGLISRKYNDFIQSFKSMLIDKGSSDAYSHKMIFKVKHIINMYCDVEGIPLGNLLNGLKYKSPTKDVEVLNPEQVKFIITQYDRMVNEHPELEEVAMYMYVGVVMLGRVGDMKSWEVGNLYELGDRTWIKYIPNKTKNSSGRTVDIPVPERVVKIFIKNKDRYNGKLMPQGIKNFYEKLKKLASYYEIFHNEVQVMRKGKFVKMRQCDAIHIHQMRGSGVSDKLMHMPEALVKEFTGHTHDSSAFAKYVKVANESKARYMDEYMSRL